MKRNDIDRQIERSSLGSDSVRRLRARTPPEVTASILQRAAELSSGRFSGPARNSGNENAYEVKQNLEEGTVEMIEAPLPDQGVIFWPVATGDSTTVVVDDTHVLQVDLHDMAKADDTDATVAAVVDRLAETLPTTDDDQPYLATFALTHADMDHVLGFEDLLNKVHIGEIWATPRMWREYLDEGIELPCRDAQAFHDECVRRVEATLLAVADGREPESGDRILVVGYDTDESEHAYSELPEKYLTGPGKAVSSLDGDDVSYRFEAFIHAPFADDCADERNETSLAMQITLRTEGCSDGHLLLLGDLAYETIAKVFRYSEEHGRPERLIWDVLLAPHHCSKRAMYVTEDGDEVLKQDLLDLLEEHASEDATVVASSDPFRSSDPAGANPPHLKARARYEEIVPAEDGFICTGEYPEADSPSPLVFTMITDGLRRLEPVSADSGAEGGTRALKAAAGLAAAGLVFELARSVIRSRRRSGEIPARPTGPDQIRQIIDRDRGRDGRPQQLVGFG
jgi:hypothetical protein